MALWFIYWEPNMNFLDYSKSLLLVSNVYTDNGFSICVHIFFIFLFFFLFHHLLFHVLLFPFSFSFISFYLPFLIFTLFSLHPTEWQRLCDLFSRGALIHEFFIMCRLCLTFYFCFIKCNHLSGRNLWTNSLDLFFFCIFLFICVHYKLIWFDFVSLLRSPCESPESSKRFACITTIIYTLKSVSANILWYIKNTLNTDRETIVVVSFC